MTTLYMVLPCYNEEEVLPETAKRLKQKYHDLMAAGRISEKSRIVFVDDGSKDKTWQLIRELHQSDPSIRASSSPATAGIRMLCGAV